MSTTRDDTEKYARESFSLRGMTRGQAWAITVVCGLIVLAGLIFAIG